MLHDKASSSPSGFLSLRNVIVVFLVIVILAGSIVIWARYSQTEPIEISLEQQEEPVGNIYIAGEINNPGFYPLKAGDTIDDILGVAGGVTDDADSSLIELTVPGKTEAILPQKIDINRADAWLLAALPDIGEGKAQAIVEYRKTNGPFRDIEELLKVEGIGESTFRKIRDFITVSD